MHGNDLIIVRYGDLKLIIKKSEAFVYYATFIAGEYNDLKIREDDIVIDAGANVGDFTIKAAHKAKKGKVIAIEPIPEYVEIIKQNVSINSLNNVEIINAALSNTTGLTKISIDSVSSSIISKKDYSIEVQTITLNDVLKRLPSKKEVVLKMDIEGAERLVFEDPSFLDRVRELSIELHGSENIQTITSILKQNGYKIKEFKLANEMANTIIAIIKHPFSFFSTERKTNWTALRGFLNTLKGKNPVPSIANKEFLKVIYAKKH